MLPLRHIKVFFFFFGSAKHAMSHGCGNDANALTLMHAPLSLLILSDCAEIKTFWFQFNQMSTNAARSHSKRSVPEARALNLKTS